MNLIAKGLAPMTTGPLYRFRLAVSLLLAGFLIAGCAPRPIDSTATPAPATSTSSTPAATSTPEAAEATSATTPVAVPVSGNDVLYQDEFTDPSTGWPEAKFDNYFIGYHEPEYYHIEIDSPNYRAPVFVPGRKSFDDVTIQVKVQVNSKKTAANGDFAYGIAFRRSGDQYYAFVVSPRTQKWMMVKSSPSSSTTLAQGQDKSLHAADVDDLLQVDAQGSTFSLHINDRLVAQVTDADYASGEVGFYVQTFDSQAAHVHFDELIIRKYQAPQPAGPQTKVLAHDDFTDASTGWPEAKFDNYFIGYHEPEYYHIEIESPNYHAPVFLPGRESFGDVTIQVKAQVNSKKTAASGDFAYGVAFRRSGDQYYAFVVSPRAQKWMMLKSTPSSSTTLAQGTDTSLHAADINDVLRVDAQGSTFSLHINGRLVGQVTDADYASGEVGLYVQTFDSQDVHIHFDELTVSDFEAPLVCKVVLTGSGLNLRAGPGPTFSFVQSLPAGASLEPLGHSLDNQWLNVRLQASGRAGWVSSSDRFVSCNRDISLLPVVIP